MKREVVSKKKQKDMSEGAGVGRRLILWSRDLRTRCSDVFEDLVSVLSFTIVFVLVFFFAIFLLHRLLITLIRYSEVFEGGRGLLSTIAIIILIYFFANRTPDPMNKNILYLLAGFLWICVAVIAFSMLISATRQR